MYKESKKKYTLFILLSFFLLKKARHVSFTHFNLYICNVKKFQCTYFNVYTFYFFFHFFHFFFKVKKES